MIISMISPLYVQSFHQANIKWSRPWDFSILSYAILFQNSTVCETEDWFHRVSHNDRVKLPSQNNKSSYNFVKYYMNIILVNNINVFIVVLLDFLFNIVWMKKLWNIFCLLYSACKDLFIDTLLDLKISNLFGPRGHTGCWAKSSKNDQIAS